MPKGSPELTKAREDEIINACEKLYETMSFKEINIKEIGNVLSFSRASIYNYFQTKEEIFLALLKREYEEWCKELRSMIHSHEHMNREEFAKSLASSLEGKEQMLKLLSMNLNDMEANSRMEKLVEFKKPYGQTMKLVGEALEKFFPDMQKEDVHEFIYTFFPFLYGVYPYTVVSEKQRQAMAFANIDYSYMPIKDLTYIAIKRMLVIKEA